MMVVVVVLVRVGWGGAWTAWEYLLPPVPSKVTPSYLFGFPRPSSSSRHDAGDKDYAEDDVDDYLVDNDEVKLHPNSRSLKRLAQSLAMNMNMMMLLIIITMVLRVLIKYTKK